MFSVVGVIYFFFFFLVKLRLFTYLLLQCVLKTLLIALEVSSMRRHETFNAIVLLHQLLLQQIKFVYIRHKGASRWPDIQKKGGLKTQSEILFV